jgi:cytoskeletal protein CcmA (bactofilin family)
MKIWEREEDKALPAPQSAPRTPVAKVGDMEAFLGKGTSFDGVLSFDGTIRLDGRLKGKIITNGVLVIGESAEVEAEINVGHLVVNGLVKGNVKARERIEILGQGRIVGTIDTPRLKVQEGAILEGQCVMQRGQATPANAPAREGKGAEKAG